MKRINNLYEQIIDPENIRLADLRARRGKKTQPGVQEHMKNDVLNREELRQMFINKTYKTSPYTTFSIFEPKERLIFRLPFFPDRIAHHAIMRVLEPIFVSTFTEDTYSCIKGRGIHSAGKKLVQALKNVSGTQFCLKLDIQKFYPSIDHVILKALLRKKFKDQDLLGLLDEIIDSADGLPIGNYLSQYLANFYLTYFDHWIKEQKGVKHYFRYADDIVILAPDKPSLHKLLADITEYLQVNLNLKVKKNYQIFPVAARSIDFVGYRFYHTHVMLRKSIKKAFARMLVRRRNPASVASYNGWAMHCNSKNLLKTLLIYN